MKAKDKLFSFMLRAGMELSWLYAWASFMTEATFKRTFPLPEALGAFMLAALSTQSRWLPGLGRWRFVWVPIVQMAGFALSALVIGYAFTDGQHFFFSRHWLTGFFLTTRGLADWLMVGVVGFFILVFWVDGVATARRRDTHTSVCHRFDLGTTAFFMLYLIKLVLVYKGGIHIRDPYSELLVFPFFIFSLLAMGIINQRSHTPKAFLSGFRGLGLILSFCLVVIGAGAAAVLLFLPYLTRAAEAGFMGLKAAAGPLEPILISILRFMFAPRRMREDPLLPNSGSDWMPHGHPPAEGGWMELLQHLIQWVVTGMLALLVAAALCAGIWLLVRWLRFKFSRMQIEDRPPSLRELLTQIGSSLNRLWQCLLKLFHGYTTAEQLFGAVMRWGSRSGLPRPAGETPLEYGRRLSRFFPLLHREIETIVDAYHTEVYRETALSSSRLKTAQASWRLLRSPRHWLRRFRTGFFSNHKEA